MPFDPLSKKRGAANVAALSLATGYAEPPSRLSTLELLARLQRQPGLARVAMERVPHPLDLELDPPDVRKLFSTVMTVDRLGPENELSPSLRKASVFKLEQASLLLNAVWSDVAWLLDNFIGPVLLAHRDRFGGGTVSSLVGVIWICPASEWDRVVFAETLVHELTHNFLFLEDMVHTIFSQDVIRMAASDGLVASAVRGVPRGYDKAFHSAWVSSKVSQFYLRLKQVKLARDHHAPVRETVDALQTRAHSFLTRNGRRVLDVLDHTTDVLGRALQTYPAKVDAELISGRP